MGFCERKGVERECLTDHSVCNSANCHRQLYDTPDVVIKNKKLGEFAELLREATVSVEDLISFVKVKAIHKELDENKLL